MAANTDSPSAEGSVTAVDYLSSQLSLEREARDLMPYDPKVCSYTMGPTRQQVYACLTCLEKTGIPSGVCYSCSIQCHSDHNLVELFTKRNFTCDCGTTRTKWCCSLRDGVDDDIPESLNRYNHNFRGKFCHCARDYNPVEETGNMLQCILGDTCDEDWFHDYCIMGLPKFDPPSPVEDDKQGVNVLDTLGEPGLDAETTNHNGNEDKEQVIDGFPRFEDFDCYVCWQCVSNHRDFFDKIKDNTDIVADTLQRIEAPTISERNDKIREQGSFLNTLKKRKMDYEYSVFLKSQHESHFKALYDQYQDDNTIHSFLDEFPFLMKDDPVYEPPQDDDDGGSSVYDLGTKAINSLPREKAIEGVQVFEDIKTKLKDFLTPFAQDGKIVNKEDIQEFFENLKKKSKD